MAYRRAIEGMSFSIEDGVPLPSAYLMNISPVTKKLLNMKAGQSFIWPNKLSTPGQISVSLNQIRRKYGAKFAYRKVEGGDIRVWRIDDTFIPPKKQVFHVVRKSKEEK